VTALAEPTLGALCALGSACTWAVTSLLVRTLNPVLGSVAINALRSTASGVLLLGAVLLLRGPAALAGISVETLVLLAVSIIAAIAIGDTVFFDSTRRLGLARGMTVAMTYPLLSAVLAAAFLDEPLSPRLAAGSALTLLGLALIVWDRSGLALPARGWWIGVGGATLAAIAWSVSVIALKAPLREVDAVTAQAIRLPIAGGLLFMTPWARGAVSRVRDGERRVVARLALLSILTASSSVMFVAAVKYSGVAVAAVLSSTAPMFALPLGLLFLGERLTAGPIVGTVVAVVGIAVLQL
jgi:drug/metabolite transporter (DMT)-like permease